MTDRLDVMNAIVTRVQQMTFGIPINGKTSWLKVDKRLKLWSDVSPDQQPCAYVVTHREMNEYRNLGLLRRRLEIGVWCYSRSDNSIGQDDLDNMMKAFDAAFGAAAVDDSSRNAFTLGGLVYWCRIEGRVFKDPGDNDNQTLLIVPIVCEMP